MAVTPPTVDDVVAFRHAPAEDWSSYSAGLLPALYAAIHWTSHYVDPSGMNEAAAVLNAVDPAPDPLATASNGDLWRYVVICKTWAYALTGFLPVVSMKVADVVVQYQGAIAGHGVMDTVAVRYDQMALDAVRLLTDVDIPLYGFTEFNDATDGRIESTSEDVSNSVRTW